MSIAITSTVIRHDGRVAGKAGEIIADFFFADGQFERCRFTAADGQDVAAFLDTLKAGREAGREAAEIRRNINEVTTLGRFATPTFIASNATQNAAALRAEFANATRTEAIMIGDYLNTLTNAQIANAFEITTGQASTLRTNKLAPAAALADSIRASTGA